MAVRNQPVFRKTDTKCYGCDVSRETQVNDTARKILGEFGDVGILVNNTGIFMDDWSHFSESKSDYWRKKIDTNIYETLYFTCAVINNMREWHYGRIVNIGFVADVYGIRKKMLLLQEIAILPTAENTFFAGRLETGFQNLKFFQRH